jgi:hypothetical protein
MFGATGVCSRITHTTTQRQPLNGTCRSACRRHPVQRAVQTGPADAQIVRPNVLQRRCVAVANSPHHKPQCMSCVRLSGVGIRDVTGAAVECETLERMLVGGASAESDRHLAGRTLLPREQIRMRARGSCLTLWIVCGAQVQCLNSQTMRRAPSHGINQADVSPKIPSSNAGGFVGTLC